MTILMYDLLSKAIDKLERKEMFLVTGIDKIDLRKLEIDLEQLGYNTYMYNDYGKLYICIFDMIAVKLDNKKFYDYKNKKFVICNGYVLFDNNSKKYVGFKHNKGIPYAPIGGKTALNDIMKHCGFVDYKDIDFIEAF